MALIFLQMTAVFYAVVTIYGLFRMLRPTEGSQGRSVSLLLSLVILVHASVTWMRASEIGRLPLSNLYDGLSFLGLVLAVLTVSLGFKTQTPILATSGGALVTGIVTVASTLAPAHQSAPPSRWFAVHLATAFLGLAIFATAGLVAFLFLLRRNQLKQKRRNEGTFKRLPSLEALDRLSLRLIMFGFPLMTIGLSTGILYSKDVLGTYWRWGILNTVSVIVWVVFAVILHFRFTIGWRGGKVATLTVGGVGATLLALFAEYLF